MKPDTEAKQVTRASRAQAESAWHVIMRSESRKSLSSSDERELWQALLGTDAQTASFLSGFVSRNPNISVAWIVGVLVDGMPGQEVRDFCMSLQMLGEHADFFDRDEVLSIGKGLRAYLPASAEMSLLTEAETGPVSALAALTATVWLHAPESKEHGIIDSPVTGIHLADRRLADLILSEPGEVSRYISFIREFETSRYEDITRHLALSSALLDGEL